MKDYKKRLFAMLISSTLIINLTNVLFNNVSKHEKIKNDTVSEDEINLNVRDDDGFELLGLYLDALDKIETNYKHSEFYPDDERIEAYLDYIELPTTCSNTLEDYSVLIDIIKVNTTNRYGKDNGIYLIPGEKYTKEEEIILKEREDIIESSLRIALDNIFKNASNNTLEDICKLKQVSLKVSDLSKVYVSENSTVLGLWNEKDLTIEIDYGVINFRNEYNQRKLENKDQYILSFEEYLANTLEHEINHARQYLCKDRLVNFSSSYTPFDYQTFIKEASAESELYSYELPYLTHDDTHNYTYLKERMYQSLLLLGGAFKEGRNIDDYYNSIFDSNLKDFYKFFDIESREEMKKLYYILYSMESACSRSDLSRKIYLDNSDISFQDLRNEIGYDYLIDLYKEIIKDLIENNERNNETLSTNILLYTIAKSYIVNSDISGYKDDAILPIESKYDIDFTKKIKEIDNIYLDYLSNKYGIDKPSLYNKTKSKENATSMSNLISYVTGGKNEFMNIIFSDRECKRLLDKYPLLNQIIWTFNTSYFDINNFDKFALTLN